MYRYRDLTVEGISVRDIRLHPLDDHYGCFAVGQSEHGKATAALFGTGAVPFIGHEALDRHQQERVERAFFARQSLEIIPSQKARKELLGQILGILRAMAMAADVGIERILILL